MSNNTLIMLFNVIIIVGGFLSYIIINQKSCTESWKDSGLSSKWEFFSGCRVKIPSGKWLPASSIREVDVSPKNNAEVPSK